MDVVVIGGGMAGVSIAYELSAHCEVALLEAEGDMPIHTTGRSAAVYLPAYGTAVVRALTADSREAFETFPDLLDAPTLLRRRAILYVADDQAMTALTLLTDIETVEPITVDGAVSLFPALRKEAVMGAAIDRSGSDIDVLGLYQAYVRGLRARGGAVMRQSRVTSLRRQRHGWVVSTSSGRHIDAPQVVNAAGAWADELAVMAGVPRLRFSALRRSVFISPVHAPDGFLSWPMLFDACERFYAKPEGDALLCSPAEEVPAEPGSPRADELLVAETIDRLQHLTTFPLRTVRTTWAGLRTFAPDRSPVAGESEPGSGFWWLAGQGGYGIQMAPALAVDLAQQMVSRVASRYGKALSPGRFGPGTDN